MGDRFSRGAIPDIRLFPQLVPTADADHRDPFFAAFLPLQIPIFRLFGSPRASCRLATCGLGMWREESQNLESFLVPKVLRFVGFTRWFSRYCGFGVRCRREHISDFSRTLV